jgi:hypothetical protein
LGFGSRFGVSRDLFVFVASFVGRSGLLVFAWHFLPIEDGVRMSVVALSSFSL